MHGDPTSLDGTGKWLTIWHPEKHAGFVSTMFGEGGVGIESDEDDEPELEDSKAAVRIMCLTAFVSRIR